MLQTKPVISFLLISVSVFIILSAPFSFYDSLYGKFYRSTCNFIFHEFHDTGFVNFKQTKDLTNTHIEIANRAHVHPDGTTELANADFNTRYRGYLPTIFFIALVMASPISRRRKIFSFFTGMILITGVIVLRQWVHLLYMCKQSPWLGLYTFTPDEQKRIEFYYLNFANYGGSTLIIVIAVWLLVSFRKSDLEIFFK